MFTGKMKRFIILMLAGLSIVSAHVTAEDFPIVPPAGYDSYRSDIPHGTIHWNVSYYSTVAGKDLIMHVYTPPAYNTSRKYGVIYCYQGIGVGPDTIFADWCTYAGNLCDNLISEGKIQPVIVVALDDQFNGDYSDVSGMTLNDGIPFVDSNYSTYADADHRGLYGYSWGGGYTFNVGCANLNTFHHLSPSAAAPNKAGDTTLFPNGGAEAKQKLKTLFISWGQWDYQSIIDANKNCHNYCVSNNIPHYWWEVPGEGHVANVWKPALWNFFQMGEAAGISDAPTPRSAYSQIEAESYNIQQGGVQIETCGEGGQDVGFIQNGSYLIFHDIEFGGGAVSFNARVASATSGGNIELYLDSVIGSQIGTCAVPNTGGWQTWVTRSCSISGVTGIHDLYVKFTGGGGYLFNVNWWKFNFNAGQDIGAVGAAGSSSYSDGVFTIAGAGADIGGTADAFRFVNVPATGDCTIIARVSSLQNINPLSKAGVMIRQDLSPNAANAFIAITPDNGVIWQYRSNAGGSTIADNLTGPVVPYWVKLVRSGDTFIGYYSPNGLTWTESGSTAIAMESTVYVGLAVTSHSSSTLCTATFDNMTAPNWPTSAAPLGLVATTASTTQINLSWDACANATSYNVKRSTVSGGPYTTIASGVTAVNYQDSTLPVGAFCYYYVVSAIIGGGETPNSAQVEATAPWMVRDIGTVGISGKISYSDGVITVSGSGDDIWNTGDAFRFVYLPLNGNGTIVARVVSMQNTDVWAKAGVMIRESLDANSRNAFIAVTPGNGVTWQYRSSTGGSTANSTTTGLVAPYWVKLVRSGNTFSGYHSPDGTNWTQQGTSQTISMASQVYIGLAVTSHNNSSICRAVFDNLTAPGWPPPLVPAIPTGLQATTISGNRINLSWTAASGATSYNIKRSTTDGGPYTLIASVSGISYSDLGVSGLTTYYYVVSAVNSSGQSADSAQVEATTPAAPPAAPSGLIATAGEGLVVLNWNANTEGNLAGYNVYRSITSGSEYTQLNGVLLSSPEFTDNNVDYYTRYYYVVTAVDNDSLESPFSNQVSVMPTDNRAVVLSAVDFEGGFGDWTNITGDDSHDWFRNSGGTLTPNTGPSGGANGSTWYVYLETSPGGANTAGNTAILQGPMIDGYNRVLMFYYHMYGAAVGALNIDVFHDGIWHNAVWSISGQQQNSNGAAYIQAIVDLNGYTGPIQIRFRAVAAGGPTGDMAIDDIEVLGKLLYGDMNGDNIVNVDDLSEFAGYWLQNNCNLDLNGDCLINLYEFAEFAENWLDD